MYGFATKKVGTADFVKMKKFENENYEKLRNRTTLKNKNIWNDTFVTFDSEVCSILMIATSQSFFLEFFSLIHICCVN